MNLLSDPKNTLSLLLLLPSLGRSAPGGPYTPQECFAGFGALGFQSTNYDAYDTYYDENSTFTLSQTGTYKGPDAIEEYIRFVDINTVYWDGRMEGIETLSKFSSSRFDPIEGTCVFSLYSTQYLKINSTLATGEFAYYGAISNIKYSIPDNKIRSINLYYEPDFLVVFFGLLDTPGIHNLVCETLYNDGCTEALATQKSDKKNKSYKSKSSKKDDKKKSSKKEEKKRRRDIRKCARRLSELPVAEGDLAYADGNTLSCRIIHAVFAESNPFHCAHIALEPTEDPAGNIKCAVSEGRSPDEFFNEEEITGLSEFCKNSTVVDDNCYRITSTEQGS